MKLLQQAAMGGSTCAMTMLGEVWREGCHEASIEEDSGAARDWFKMAADMEHAPAMNQLGMTLCDSEPTAALWHFRRGSKLGDADCHYNLGIFHERGMGGLRVNQEVAVKHYRIAAQSGHREAKASWGFFLLQEKRHAEALETLRAASSQGSAVAHYYLGEVFSHGIGFPPCLFTAAHHFTAASDLGETRATLQLAHAFFSGKGVDKSLTRAFALYKKAAKRDVAEACNCLGIMYEDGLGCERNLNEAQDWFEKGAELGNPDAAYNLAHLVLVRRSRRGSGSESGGGRRGSSKVSKSRRGGGRRPDSLKVMLGRAAALGSEKARGELEQMAREACTAATLTTDM